jgi:hypothetical protein
MLSAWNGAMVPFGARTLSARIVGTAPGIRPNYPIRLAMSAKQRKEIRIPISRPVHVHIRGGRTITAVLHDVSRSGIAVEVRQWLAIGAHVRVTGEGFAAEGKVRYCQPHLKGYKVGVVRSTE